MKAVIFTLLVASLPFSAMAAATTTSYSEEQAEAYFSSVQGCEDVVVGVSVVETERVLPKGPLPPTQAFVFGTFNNICDIGSSYSFSSVVPLTDGQFSQNGLKKASLNLTTNIGGFDLAILLDWKGVGTVEKNRSKVRTKNNGIIIRDSDVIAARASDMSGSFLVNGINYAVGTETGGLSTLHAHTVERQK